LSRAVAGRERVEEPVLGAALRDPLAERRGEGERLSPSKRAGDGGGVAAGGRLEAVQELPGRHVAQDFVEQRVVDEERRQRARPRLGLRRLVEQRAVEERRQRARPRLGLLRLVEQRAVEERLGLLHKRKRLLQVMLR